MAYHYLSFPVNYTDGAFKDYFCTSDFFILAQKKLMSTKKRKPRNAKGSGSLSTVLLVIILLAVVAAITAYYLSKKPVPRKKQSTEQTQNQKKNNSHQKTASTRNPSEVKTILEGNWVSQSDGALLEFHNNTFSIDLPSVDSHNYKKGIFSINGNQINFSYTNANVTCGKEKGVYTFKLSDGSLHLKAKKDDCKFRKLKLVATWDRFNAK